MIQKVKYSLLDLQNSNDDELIALTYNKAMELYFATFGETLEKADQAMTELLATWILESEVKNGGFDQFFQNNGLERGQIASNGLKRIGAGDFLKVTEKAIDVFKNQRALFQNERNPVFNSFDESFYQLDGLEKLRIKYIRNNYGKFVVE